MNTLRVLLVDDHALVLLGLKQLLMKERDIEVVGTLSDPLTLLAEISRTSPDVIVIDVRLKKYNGIELTKVILEKFPNLKVVVLSGYDYEEYLEAAFNAGASAFVTKEKSNEELTSVIRQVSLGYKVFPRQYSNQAGESLTHKEREVLKLIAEDKSNYEIGKELIISKRTVEHHISSIIKKMNADSRVGAVVQAIKKGILHV